MPRKSDKDRWESAADRFEKIEKKIRPFVRPTKDSGAYMEEAWRPSGELQNGDFHGFRGG